MLMSSLGLEISPEATNHRSRLGALKHSNTDPLYPLNKIKTKLGRNTQQTGKMTARPVLPGSLKGAQLQPRSWGDSDIALGRDQRLPCTSTAGQTE